MDEPNKERLGFPGEKQTFIIKGKNINVIGTIEAGFSTYEPYLWVYHLSLNPDLTRA